MNLFDVYSLYDIEPVKGLGCHVYTADGTPIHSMCRPFPTR